MPEAIANANFYLWPFFCNKKVTSLTHIFHNYQLLFQNLKVLSSSLFPTSCEHQFIDIHTGKVRSISISIIEIDFFAKDFHFATFMPSSTLTWTSVTFLAVINTARNNLFKLIFDFYDIPLIQYSQQDGRFYVNPIILPEKRHKFYRLFVNVSRKL